MAPIANNLSLPCTFTGTIQGVTEGKEPLYWIWLGDRWGWVRESAILGVKLKIKAMDEQKIYCDTTFVLNNGTPGQHVELYDENVSVDDYRKRFETEALKMNVARKVTVEKIEITTHDEVGNYMTDDKGDRIKKIIWESKNT